MKEYFVNIPIYLADPCELVTPVLNPPWDYIGENSWVMSADKTVNDFATFNIEMPVGKEYCIYDANYQLTLTLNAAYIVPADKTMPF